MRVLFTMIPSDGYFYPLVPLAQALTAANHEVAFATLPNYAARVEAAGFRFLPVGPDAQVLLASPARQEFLKLEGDQRAQNEFARLRWFPDIVPRAVLPDLLERCETWAPDLIVTDNCEFSGRIAAERRGIPHASLKVGEIYAYADRHEPVPALDAVRASVGLPPDPDGAMLFRYLYLVNDPPAYQSTVDDLPPTSYRFRRVPYDQSGDETLQPWIGDLPRQPTVYATAGTLANKIPGVLEGLLAALRDEPINLILTIGRDRDPADLGIQPPNVHVERYIPQSLVLPFCDLVVSHAGSGTINTALVHGIPQVNVPIQADQPEHAARCAALHVGLTVGPESRTPEAIRAAVRAVLVDPSYRENARRISAQLRELPGPEDAVRVLERLTVDKQPFRASPSRG